MILLFISLCFCLFLCNLKQGTMHTNTTATAAVAAATSTVAHGGSEIRFYLKKFIFSVLFD